MNMHHFSASLARLALLLAWLLAAAVGTARAQAPTITYFAPSSGPVGTVVTVRGTNFTAPCSVTLSGFNIPFTLVNSTTITFTVGPNTRNGMFEVTTSGGSANTYRSTTYTTVVPLYITGFSPGRNQRDAARPANVALTFSYPLQNTAATRGALRVYSQQRGGQLRDGARATATVSGNTLTLDPTTDFRPGETLLVTTTPAATATNGYTLEPGQVHQFTAATGGTGGGTFVGGSDPAAGSSPQGLAVGDVDGDGDLDQLTVTTALSGRVNVRLNGGDATGSNTGTFSGGSTVSVGPRPYSVALGDVDGDGDLDLLTANNNTSGTVSVRLNGGDASGSNTGVFSNGSDVAVGREPYSVAVGDVDGDGDLDFITANGNNPGTVSVRLNGGNATGSNTGVFAGGSDPAVGSVPFSVAVGDVDNDGDLDLLTANSLGNSVSVLLNGGDNHGTNTGLFGIDNFPITLDVGVNPKSVVLGDVDGDGDLDLLTANSDDNTVSVSLNENDNAGYPSGYYRITSVSVGSRPFSVALGDVDGDGDLDLVTANRNGNTASVRLNGGDASGSNTGVFSNGSDVAVGTTPYAVALGDVDGDLDLDLLTANVVSDNVSVRLNVPSVPTITGFTPTSGPIGQTVTVTVTGTNLNAATAVTVNGVAGTITGTPTVTSLTFTVGAGSSSGFIRIVTPGGTATSVNSFFVPFSASGFTPASGPVGQRVTVTGASLDETTAVTVNGTPGTIVGTPTPTSFTFVVGPGSTSGPIIVTSVTGSTINIGNFTVLTAVAVTGLSPGRNQRNAARPADVALTFSQPLQNTAATRGALRVYSQQRGGQLRDGARATATVSGNTLTLDPTTDFRPGETLLVTTTPAATATNGNTLAQGHVYQFTAATGGTGRGIFGGGTDPAVGSRPYSVAVGDVDGDGDLDLLTANSFGNSVSVRLNGGNASGSNTGVFSNGSDVAVGSSPNGVALGDVDGDGDLDLLIANVLSNSVSVRLNGGNASGSNTGGFSNGSDVAVGSYPYSVAVGDVDGDGDLDFVTANNNGNSVSVRLNGGDATGLNAGSFSNGSDVAVGTPTSVALGDVDGDGDLDLLVANRSGNSVSVRLNGGDATGLNAGSFSNGSDVAVGAQPFSLTVGDVDGDGDLDLLTANAFGNSVSVRLNGGDASGSGTGVFSNGSDPVVGSDPYSMTIGDVDGDGDLDLLTANNTASGTVSVRLNGGDASGSGTGVFSNGSDIAVGSEPNGVALGDVDGDGDLDLLAANYRGNSVSVRLNQTLTITSFTPTSGLIGQTVTVTGTNLNVATAVTVNGVAGTIVGTPTATSLTFTVGAGSTTGVIGIVFPGGTVTSSSSFTVILAPVISGFSPTSAATGATVTVSGTSFSGASALTVGGTAVAFTLVNSTTLTFVVPANGPSGLIAVTTPAGTGTSAGSFTFLPPPTITSVSPTSANTGSTITITGTNLGGATGVTLNGVPVTGFTVVNGTTITFTLPAGATSGPIGLTAPGGTVSGSATPLTVDNTPPTATLSTPANPTSDPRIPFTVTFSEPVTGFGAAGISVSNGTITPGSVSGSGTTYTFTVTPTSSGPATVVVGVRVLANAARDAATNPNPATSITSVTYVPAPDLVNTGTQLTVQAGGILYVGTTGLRNQGGTLTNGGTLHVAGPLINPGTLALGAGTLEVRGNLTNSGTLTPGTSVVTFSGLTDQTLTPGGATLYQVLVNKPTAGANTLRLAGDLAVSNALTITTGVLATGSSAQVLLGPSATLSETTAGYVTGTVETTRPVSTAGTAQAFGGLGLRLTPAGTRLPGSTRVRRTTGTALTGAGSSQSIRRYFDIVPAVNTGLNVTLALTYRDDELNGIAKASLALFKSQTGTAGPWARQAGATLDAGTNTVTKTGISDFSIWTLGNASNPLPVTLLDFTAQAEGLAAVRLRCATAQELDNAGFTVERSLDGTAFTDLGTVAGAGSSTTRHAYTWLDTPLPAGATLLYYRLRQTDHDGTVSYSPVRAVPLGGAAGAASFVVFPTRVAAGQDAQYRYTGPAEAGTLHIVNVLGQVLGTVALDGRATGPVPLAGLPAGTYFLRYTGPAGRFTTRCVVD